MSTKNAIAEAVAGVLNAAPAFAPEIIAVVESAPAVTLENLSEIKVFATPTRLSPLLHGVGEDTAGGTAEVVVTIACPLSLHDSETLERLTVRISERIRDADLTVDGRWVIVTDQEVFGDGEHPFLEGVYRTLNLFVSAIRVELLL